MTLDDEFLTDGDQGFTGMVSRPNAATLTAGLVQEARNMRMERGVARSRRGALRLAEDIALESEIVALDFTLAEDVAVTSITRASTTATVTATAHGYLTGAVVNIRGAVEDDYNGDFSITVTGSDEFTYTVSGSPATPATGTIFANAGPVVLDSYEGGLLGAGVFSSPNTNQDEYIVLVGATKVYLWRDGETVIERDFPTGEIAESGDNVTVMQAYGRLYVLRCPAPLGVYAPKAVTSITRATTTATVTATAHGFATGDRVRIEGAAQAAYLQEFDITVTGVDEFTFTVAFDPTTPATGTITARKVKPPIYWLGGAADFVKAAGGNNAAGATFATMPSGCVATYVNNQVCMVMGRDAVYVSDILDPDTYDPFVKQFRANAGSDDYVVALHPWVDRQILVFGRKSILMASIALDAAGTAFDAEQSRMELMTNEIGCVARGTVCTAGSFVYFLSDSGVYRLDTKLDLKLRGDTRPLSEPVQDVFDRVNGDFAHKAQAVYFNNRLWLALPVDGSETNNALLVYSHLNEQWESLDEYFINCDFLVVSDYEGRKRLFAGSRVGTLFLLDERTDGDDKASGTGVDEIVGEVLTRQFNYGLYEPKRYVRAAAGLLLAAGATAQAGAEFVEADYVQALQEKVNGAATEEDFSMKVALRRMAHGAALRVIFDKPDCELRYVTCLAAAPKDAVRRTRTMN